VGYVEPLTPENAPLALAYLGRRPYDNVYVHWMLETGQLARSGRALLWRNDAAAIAGFCYFGAQIVPCADDEAAFDAFAADAGVGTEARMIVGPRRAVERFWSRVQTTFPVPSAIRASQPLYALERRTLRYSRDDADVGLATSAELDDIVPHSARMIAGEVGGDPTASSAFRSRTARIIEARWWWRYRVGGKLAFMCNVGSATPYTAQLQGVWTPPEMRGRGHAARALGAICDRLLDEHRTLCLYVNSFNAPAVALYERVGFEHAGEFSTILL
jgi:hypothetical protein